MHDRHTEDLAVRRRRASYRAAHRGTKELDFLIGRFADARLGCMPSEGLEEFERFLALPDPTLQAWIFADEFATGTAFERLVEDIRSFHGLGRTPQTKDDHGG